jgi:hypothetical protein
MSVAAIGNVEGLVAVVATPLLDDHMPEIADHRPPLEDVPKEPEVSLAKVSANCPVNH